MAKLILKSPYIKSTGGASGYLKYIATRERVEIIHRELAEEPVYSFAREEEERACRKAQVHDKDDTDA